MSDLFPELTPELRMQAVAGLSRRASEPASLAVPRKGYVLSRAAELYGAPIRYAAALLGDSAPRKAGDAIWRKLYARRIVEPGEVPSRGPVELAAWMVVAAWATGIATGHLRKGATLHEAEAWFLGSVATEGFAALLPRAVLAEAEFALNEIADRKALQDLLPYILDPHGEGSRMSVMLRPETAQARARKREDGVFYTPADVAGFMAAGTIRQLTDDAIPLTIMDPACGSGVFLRAVLSELRLRSPGIDEFDLACSCLYGTDIDPWAVNAAAFVLLADCVGAVEARRIAPIAAWHALRLNLVHINALRLDPGQALPHDNPARVARLACRTTLKANILPEVSGQLAPTGPVAFDRVFPELAEGTRIVIGNPPYADIGAGNDLLSLSKRFETLQAAPRPTSDMYPLFVEQMIRLTAPNAHGGAMVLPLSIACNTGRQFLALRRLLARTSGHWQFAFFDREPHALFGEDVKTRNAIVLWTRHGNEAGVQISTGPLRKWRGGDRARMLECITFTPMDADIRPGIPKVEGPAQAEALHRLLIEQNTLLHAVTHIGRATLSDARKADTNTVFVGATAYNFLSVFLRPDAAEIGHSEQLTENPMLALSCASREAALQLFALLSSMTAFWWWHVHGDGFHVSRHVVETLPVGAALRDPERKARLARFGEALWQEVSENPVVSRNRGRVSLGFSAAASPLRKEIDALFLDALGLKADFVGELERFCEGVTNAQLAPKTEQNNQRTQAHDVHAVC